MTWIPLLLADPSPSLRILVLKNLLNRSEKDEEITQLRKIQTQDAIIDRILKLQLNNGSWDEKSLWNITSPGGNIQTTSQQLVKLSYLGFTSDNEFIKNAISYLFSQQNEDGSWPLPNIKEKGELEGYDMQPLQTIVPLEGIAAVGYSQDERAEKAYEWLLKQQLDDGSWPVGISNGVYGGIAGYRRIAHSRWGCRSTTIGALNCFSYHPLRKESKVAKRALDLILGCETKAESNLGFVVSRILGFENSRGWITYYPRLDPAHILSLCSKIGTSAEDSRVGDLIQFVQKLQGKNGIWECKAHPQANRWLTYDILFSLKSISKEIEWISYEPRTPFREYQKTLKRF